MPPLPPASDFTAATVTEAQFKTALTALRDYLSGLLGATGTPADALAALGALGGARIAPSAATTLSLGDRGRVVDATGTWALTLPGAAAAGSGWSAVLRNGGAGTITLTPAGGDLIDGAASSTLAAGRAALLCSTGTAWFTLDLTGTAGGSVIDLPVAGTGVQSSGVDTTANRLLRVGAFGIGLDNVGASLTPGNDLNALRVSGIWRFQSPDTGSPGFNGVMLHMVRGAGLGAAFHVQLAMGTTGQLVARYMLDGTGTWSAWTAYRPAGATVDFGSGNLIGGGLLTVADDAVGSYSLPRNGGLVAVTSGATTAGPVRTESALIWYDGGSTPDIEKVLSTATYGSLVDVSTVNLTGTTGTDGRITVGVQAGVLQIENRRGASRSFSVNVL